MGDSPWSDCEQAVEKQRKQAGYPPFNANQGGNTYYRITWEDDEIADLSEAPALTSFNDLPDLGRVPGPIHQPMTPPPTPPRHPKPPPNVSNAQKSEGMVFLRPPTSPAKTNPGGRGGGGVVLGVGAAYTKANQPDLGLPPGDLGLEEDTHPQVTYPAKAGGKGLPLLEVHSRRPRGQYRPPPGARGTKTAPATKGSNFENTRLSLLSDDENILAQEDAESTSPFSPDHTAILQRPKSRQVLWPRSKRRRALIWGLIIAGAMVIAGTVTYLIVHLLSG